MHAAVFCSGLDKASISVDMFFWISGWVMTDATSASAAAAAADTFGCVSCRQSMSFGIATGMARPSWCGARLASSANSCRLVSFVFHALSRNRRLAGAECGAARTNTPVTHRLKERRHDEAYALRRDARRNSKRSRLRRLTHCGLRIADAGKDGGYQQQHVRLKGRA